MMKKKYEKRSPHKEVQILEFDGIQVRFRVFYGDICLSVYDLNKIIRIQNPFDPQSRLSNTCKSYRQIPMYSNGDEMWCISPSDVEQMCKAANITPTPRRFIELIKRCEALSNAKISSNDKVISVKPIVNTKQVILESPFGPIKTERDSNNNLLFCLSDLCKILELKSTKVVCRLEPDMCVKHYVQTSGGTQEATFVNEEGLYETVFKCIKPNSREFRKWLISKAMPIIHNVPSEHALHIPQTYLQALEALVEAEKEKIRLKQANILCITKEKQQPHDKKYN